MESCKNSLVIRPEPASSAIVSPFLFGENLEHTRSDVFMGLSAQLLRNRKFAGKPMACSGHSMEWYPVGEKTSWREKPMNSAWSRRRLGRWR